MSGVGVAGFIGIWRRAPRLVVTFSTFLATLAACQSSPGPAGGRPAFSPPAGAWAGTITGRDMATAHGIIEVPARLTLDPDRRWTLTAGVASASGTAGQVGHALVLEGVMNTGDPMTIGRAVPLLLGPRGPHVLHGWGQHFFLGHRIDVVIMLRRLPG